MYTQGYYGGVRLLQATLKAFYNACTNANLNHKLSEANGFNITYTSTIPRMVSLSKLYIYIRLYTII